jgi:hypothetical protein
VLAFPAFAVLDDWQMVQQALGSALRLSKEEVTREQLPVSNALLLVRVAFAEVMLEIVQEEGEAS